MSVTVADPKQIADALAQDQLLAQFNRREGEAQPWYMKPMDMEGRATFLPFKDTLPGSVMNQRELALPGLLAGAVNAFTAPSRVSTQGFDAPEEALNLATNVFGGGITTGKMMRNPTGVGGTDLAMNSIKDISDKWNSQGVNLDIYPSKSGEKINLSKIIVAPEKRNQGLGSQVMQDIVQQADNTNAMVTLSPSTDFGATSVSRLKDFYKQFGFVENKGKNKDFSVSESMYRKPTEKKIDLETQPIDTSYRGSHVAPNAERYGATLDNLGGIMPADVYSSKGISRYGINDPAIDREWFAAAYRAKNNPNYETTVWRAVPKGVKDINSGDWVTTSKTYAKNHGENTLNGEYDLISSKVKANTLTSEGYPYEFGYHQPTRKELLQQEFDKLNK